MPFEKGDNRINRAGRPEGAKNRVNDEIRTRINTFLDENFETIQSDIKDLEPRERVRFYIELLQYGVPKLKQTELKTEVKDLPPLRLIFKDLSKE
jgi:hypothetical protein